MSRLLISKLSFCKLNPRTSHSSPLLFRGKGTKFQGPLLWKLTSTAWIFFFFHENFSTYILKYSLQFFFMLCSHFQNNQCKKISKFEREDESNGIPLVQHGISFFFHENFPVNIHSDSFPFFIMLCSYFLNNECRKKFEIKEETLKQLKPTSTQRIWKKLC